MKATFTAYEHSRIGFPTIVLKWVEQNHKALEPYITVRGIIQPWQWMDSRGFANKQFYAEELERFDKWVASIYSNDASFQD